MLDGVSKQYCLRRCYESADDHCDDHLLQFYQETSSKTFINQIIIYRLLRFAVAKFEHCAQISDRIIIVTHYFE